jgi:putative modified peptide
MSFKLSEPIVDALLEKLANDDEFRSLFASDTRSALATLGYAPAMDRSVTQGIWFCLRVESLASKESIRAGMGELRLQFTTAFIPLMPFALEGSQREQHHAA